MSLAYEVADVHAACPGPSIDDVGVLLRGSVPRRALGARRVVLRLRGGRGFAGAAHTGATSGEVTIVLRRVAVREAVVTELF